MSDRDELLRQKYPSMYEGEKSDIADVKSDDTTPSLGGSKSKPKKGTSNDLPLQFRDTLGQAKGKIFYRQQRLRDYDEAAAASKLPDWLIVSLRQRLETEIRHSVSIFDLKDGPYTYKDMLTKLNLSFPEGAGAMEKRSEKYPSMGSVKDTIQSWCAEGYEEPDPDEEETEVVDEL